MSMPSNNKIEDRALGALRNIIDDHATMGHEFCSMDKEILKSRINYTYVSRCLAQRVQ